jgi:hypothetical protein
VEVKSMKRRDLQKTPAAVAVVTPAPVPHRHAGASPGCPPAPQFIKLKTLETVSGPDLQPGRRLPRIAQSVNARLSCATETGFQELNKGGRVPASFARRPPKKESA